MISGASSVPGLSGAVVDAYAPLFSSLRSVEHYISPGNQTQRGNFFFFISSSTFFFIYNYSVGIATVQSVLQYCGKDIKMKINDDWKKVTGWQDTHTVTLRGISLIIDVFIFNILRRCRVTSCFCM